MKTCRIHITGAAGAGTTTIGLALAGVLALSHFDADDFLWSPTTPPYRALRAPQDRLRLMREMFLDGPRWALSGSAMGWGIDAYFDLVVFVVTSPAMRQRRLRVRETQRFGVEAVSPGGWRNKETESFLEWARHYEDGTQEGRSLGRHLAWLEKMSCQTLSVDGEKPVENLVAEIAAAL